MKNILLPILIFSCVANTSFSQEKSDFKTAIGIFFLVFISTFPVVIPFLFITEAQLALRISNLVAIVFMFICGWLLASYGNYNKIVSSITIAIIGVLLVGLTILLGG